MDNGEDNVEPGETDSDQWSTKETTDDVGYGGRMRPSEFAKQELQRIRDQLVAKLDRASGSKNDDSTPIQGQRSSSVPTDLTVSESSNLAGNGSCSVIFEGPTTEQGSSVNLIPDFKKRLEQQGQAAREGSSTQLLQDRKKLSEMRTAFDALPSGETSLSEFGQEFAQKRMRSHKRMCDLACEVYLKERESDFVKLQLDSANKNLEAAKKEVASKEAENRQLRQDMVQLESKSSGRILELTLDLRHKTAKLETYEQLYSQMNELANVDGLEPEGLPVGERLNSVSSGVAIPVNLKYKLQSTMDLSQRLKEERDHLERCRDEADRKLRSVETKYQGTLMEMNKLKIGEDMKLSNAKAALQLKCFELERTNIALEDYKERYKATMDDNQSLKEKVESLSDAFNEVKNERTAEITRLSLELESKSSRLELYEGIETSLDEMILKAAKIPDASVGQDLLSFCTSGTSLPTDARRRLQQAYDLAKRNCELEKNAADQKQEILQLYDERQTLRSEVQDIKSLSGHSVGQLVETITGKNREISKLNSRITLLEQDFSTMKSSKELLETTVENMKSYQEEVLKLFHSGARVNQSKLERQGATAADRVSSTTVENEAASSKSTLRLGKSQVIKGNKTPAHSRRSSEDRPSKISIRYGSSAHATRSDSTRTFPATRSRLLLEPNHSNGSNSSTVLRTIAEERQGEPAFDSTFLTSSSSVTSSMFGPPPRVLSTRFVKRIPAARPTAASRNKKQSIPGSKVVPGRHVASSDLVVEHTKMEKPVPLRKSKVMQCASTYF